MEKVENKMMNHKVVSEEDIQKALAILEEFSTDEAEDIKKAEEVEIPEGEEAKEEETSSKEEIDYDSIVKAVSNELSSKFQSLARVNKFLVEENEELKEINSEIKKSITEQGERLEKMFGLVEQMANSPINKLGSFTKAVQVEKFGNGQDNGKEQLSVTRDKRKITSLLMKSLDTEEGQRRLGDVVGLVENGFVNQENFGYIKKSLENEFGGNYNIVI